MYVFSCSSLSSLGTDQAAESWIKRNNNHYYITCNGLNVFSLEEAVTLLSLNKRFNPGPGFIIRAPLTIETLKGFCRSGQIRCDRLIMISIDVFRSVRVIKEIDISAP